MIFFACLSANFFPVGAIGIVDPAQDVAFLEFEPYPRFKDGPPVTDAQNQFWRIAGQLSFPAGHLGSHQVFGSYKSTFINRDIVYDSVKLNDGVLKRFWLAGGATIVDNPKTNSIFMAGLGLNSDMADLSLSDFNTEWIYAQTFIVSPAFNWGLGLDVQQYFHKYEPYPLIFVEWRISDRTKLKWDADYLELRGFFTSRLCFTGGVRFNLEFFSLKDDAEYEYNSMGLETGMQYALGSNCYLRLKYKELVWGQEILGLPDGTHHIRDIERGRSLRFNFAYGL